MHVVSAGITCDPLLRRVDCDGCEMRPHGFRRSQVYNLYENIRPRGASEYRAEWEQGEAHPGQRGYIATFFENRVKDR